MHDGNPPNTEARKALRRKASWLAIAALAIGATALHGSFGRPLWIDEFLHFALGSFRSTGEAWDTVRSTTVTVNHGQTGVYMMIDYGLLQLFGASPSALRLPSLVSALLLFWGAVALLRFRELGPPWQVLVVVALFSNAALMYFAGEARPYMPLAAAATGALAYYLAPPPLRSRFSVRALGFVSISWGALIHPYFSLYWLTACLFAYGVALANRTVVPSWRSFLSHASIRLSALGMVLYFTMGALTWLRGGPAFRFDPFYYLKRDQLVHEFIGCHVNFLAGDARRSVLLIVFALAPAVVAFSPRRWRERLLPLLAPSILLVLALALSALIGWLAYRRNYWVLTRQWVASMALATVSVVWLWGELARAAGRVHRALGLAVFVLSVACVVPRGGEVLRERAQSFRSYLAERTAPTGEPSPADTAPDPSGNDGWVALANANVRAGGPVWTVFRRYYEGSAWAHP